MGRFASDGLRNRECRHSNHRSASRLCCRTCNDGRRGTVVRHSRNRNRNRNPNAPRARRAHGRRRPRRTATTHTTTTHHHNHHNHHHNHHNHRTTTSCSRIPTPATTLSTRTRIPTPATTTSTTTTSLPVGALRRANATTPPWKRPRSWRATGRTHTTFRCRRAVRARRRCRRPQQRCAPWSWAWRPSRLRRSRRRLCRAGTDPRACARWRVSV